MKTIQYTILLFSALIIIFWGSGFGATISLHTTNESLIANCQNTIDIIVDTEGEDIFGVATTLQYDDQNIEILGFYLNEQFNLPMNLDIKHHNGTGLITSAALSMIKNMTTNKQVGFSGRIKYASMIIKNKEPINKSSFHFMFAGPTDRTDTMDVFRLGDAWDILTTVSGGTFVFTGGTCIQQSPEGINQLDSNYDYQKHLAANLEQISQLQKRITLIHTLQRILSYRSYAVILLLLIILLFIMYKKGYLHLNYFSILYRKKG